MMSIVFALADSRFVATSVRPAGRWSVAEGMQTNSWYDSNYGFEAILYLHWTNSINKVWSIVGASLRQQF